MIMKRIILFSAITLLIFATMSCEKKETEKELILPNAKITKTFSIMYQSAKNEINIENGKIVIVNSQKELNEIFKEGYLTKELTNVDFTKNTVIAGRYATTNGVSKVEHKFSKVGDKYEYILTIVLDDTCVAQGVGFGIIVEKIPNNSEIIFKVNVIS